MDIKDLKQGQILDNQDIMDTFGCSGQGGMRRSRKTNTLVLISNHIKSIYDDRWYDDIFHYTGMGQNGDQSLNFMQNKTLNESRVNGVNVHLFEVFKEKLYTYMGQVELANSPYKEKQLDDEKNERDAYVFPLKLADGKHSLVIDDKTLETIEVAKEKKAEKLSDSELRERLKNSRSKPGTRTVITTTYDRDQYVVEYARRRANGICDLCEEPAPFRDKNGRPYLEVHHIEWLSRSGQDTVDNTAALCPNCHRKMHALENESDKNHLKNKVRISN
jgi:5-methylcytosine-specific restriction protein A